MKYLFLFITLFVIHSYAQTPSFTKIGTQELEGVHVYTIKQDKFLNYWFGTNRGIYQFNGVEWKRLKCEGIKGNSVFSLTENSKGELFCGTLTGQIIKIYKNECEVFLELPDSLIGSGIAIKANKKDDLIVTTNRLFSISTQKKIKVIVPEQGYFAGFFENNNVEIWCSGNVNNETKLFKINNDELNISTLKGAGHGMILDWFNSGKDFIGFSYIENQFYKLSKDSLIQIKPDDFYYLRGESIRVSKVNDQFWLNSMNGGVKVLDESLNHLFNENGFYNDLVISHIFEDVEGNILLGTFGEGVLVIKNNYVFDFNKIGNKERATSIESIGQKVFIGTQNGKVYEYNDTNLTTFSNKQDRSIDGLFKLENHGYLFVGENKGKIYDLNQKKIKDINIGVVKDIEHFLEDEYLIALNQGVSMYNAKNHTSRVFNSGVGRCYSVEFDPVSKTIYVGSSTGLKLLDNTGEKIKEFDYLVNDILYFDGKVYLATVHNGLLIFKNNKLLEKVKIEYVRQLKLYKKQLVISYKDGLLLADSKGNILKKLDSYYGVQDRNIIDIELVNDLLWVVNYNGVQQVDLSKLEEKSTLSNLSFQEIIINDTILNNLNSSEFNSDQNSFKFKLLHTTLKDRENVTYSYFLEGADNYWQENNYENNTIEYKQLAPGNYTFLAKAVSGNRESNTIEYSFEIDAPFWEKWWFYLLNSLGVLLIAGFVFNRRLQKQKAKSKMQSELNASKLTAIQSQMNPHFIFNALNSIQDLVLKQEVEQSYTYITKFADLVRSTLNYSEKDFIDFESELKLIELYISLEKLRFKEINFTINKIDADGVYVPPMLIQPFIENALVHGLLHKEGDKELSIDFKLESELVCTITDNGVGRKAAQQIKERQQKKHESFAINAIRKRFEILQQNFGGKLGFEYFDLEEGTKVILKIPYQHKY